MKTLFILNDPPYGTERCYNAPRPGGSLVMVFLQYLSFTGGRRTRGLRPSHGTS